MSNYPAADAAVMGAMSKLVLDEDNKRYTLKMEDLMVFIQTLNINKVLGWSDRQHFIFERNPEGYIRRLFKDAGVNGLPVEIV